MTVDPRKNISASFGVTAESGGTRIAMRGGSWRAAARWLVIAVVSLLLAYASYLGHRSSVERLEEARREGRTPLHSTQRGTSSGIVLMIVCGFVGTTSLIAFFVTVAALRAGNRE